MPPPDIGEERSREVVDLNEHIPSDAGWKLVEAHGINASMRSLGACSGPRLIAFADRLMELQQNRGES